MSTSISKLGLLVLTKLGCPKVGASYPLTARSGPPCVFVGLGELRMVLRFFKVEKRKRLILDA